MFACTAVYGWQEQCVTCGVPELVQVWFGLVWFGGGQSVRVVRPLLPQHDGHVCVRGGEWFGIASGRIASTLACGRARTTKETSRSMAWTFTAIIMTCNNRAGRILVELPCGVKWPRDAAASNSHRQCSERMHLTHNNHGYMALDSSHKTPRQPVANKVTTAEAAVHTVIGVARDNTTIHSRVSNYAMYMVIHTAINTEPQCHAPNNGTMGRV